MGSTGIHMGVRYTWLQILRLESVMHTFWLVSINHILRKLFACLPRGTSPQPTSTALPARSPSPCPSPGAEPPPPEERPPAQGLETTASRDAALPARSGRAGQGHPNPGV